MTSVFENPINTRIDDSIVAEPPRAHLGMSQIAGDARTLWLSFRWSLPDDATSRTRRIWALGKVIEAEIIRLLAGAGFELFADDGGEQFGFSFLGGHFAGSMDGVIRGLPQAPTKWHVFEAKSVKAARFALLQKVGLKEWDPVYFGQCQSYMGASKLDRALFGAYNKDTSELYFERIPLDPLYFPAMLTKAEQIITGPIPESSYPGRTHYEVKKFKSEHWQRVYWRDELPPHANCRNCRFSVADTEGGGWGCRLYGKALTYDEQRAGCDHHNFIPDLMPADKIGESADSVTYRHANGVEFTNGPEKYSSDELIELSRVDFDPQIANARLELSETFGENVRVAAARRNLEWA